MTSTVSGRTGSRYGLAAAALTLLLVAGCGGGATGAPGAPDPDARTPEVVRPGAPGEPTAALRPGEDRSAPGHTRADVEFMQGMIHHHAQALVMAALVPERAERDDVRLLARRIAVSQDDEIARMQQWLAARGEHVPDPAESPGTGHEHEDHHGQHVDTHGMLTAGEMERLAATEGEEFDRLFLEAMIHHHEGAIRMVRELFDSPGAAQGSEIYAFASHVESDQLIEIERMRRMLQDGNRGAGPAHH